MSTSTDITIVQNATFHMQVTWTTSGSDQTPRSLAGYHAHMQLRLKAGAAGSPLLDLSSLPTVDSSGATIQPALTLEPNGDTGVVSIRIGAQQTALLKKNCVYDLFLIFTADPSESVRLVKGDITLDKSVTVS